MSDYTCSSCGSRGLGMYGHHNPDTGGMRCEEPPALPDPLPEIKMMADSELVALRAEVVKLRSENEALRKERDKAVSEYAFWLGQAKSETVNLCACIAERDALKKENDALKTIERQRWENVNRTLGTNYPKQMNEGESAKWTTENRSASQWARDGGH